MTETLLRCSLDVYDLNEEWVYLTDLDGRVSMTNDAEQVTAWAHKYFPGRRVMYKDTMGRWDEMVHQEGVFQSFAPGHAPTESA